MNKTIEPNKFYDAQLDVWEKLITHTLQTQSDSLCSGIRSALSEPQFLDRFTSELVQFNCKQIESWLTVEQELLALMFKTVKEFDHAVGYSPETGKQAADRFIEHWGYRADKAMEAHREFYQLIFPWNDGDESTKTEQDEIPKKAKTNVKQSPAAAA